MTTLSSVNCINSHHDLSSAVNTKSYCDIETSIDYSSYYATKADVFSSLSNYVSKDELKDLFDFDTKDFKLEINKYGFLRWKYSGDNIEDNKEKDMKHHKFEMDNKCDLLTDIKIIVPKKVVEVFFSDGLKEKLVCHEDDKFDLRDCLFIAIAKHLYKSEYTSEGIEYKANELKYLKKYVKIVDSALKNYYKLEEQKKKLEKAAESEKEIELRKKAKAAKRKAKRKEKQRNERISEMVEAYVNAMMIVGELRYDFDLDYNEDHDCENCECRLEHGCKGDGNCDFEEDDLK